MRLVFAGTPHFAALQLRALQSHGHDIMLVLTQPDRPAGRGLRSSSSAVKKVATESGIALLQPPTLKNPELQAELSGLPADAWVVAAYGLILPGAILSSPRYGCLNIHASLLPRWRGAAPIQRAIMAGDRQTGISIMQMDEGLDTGPVFIQHQVPILEEDTAKMLEDRLAALGTQLILETLQGLPSGSLVAKPQSREGVSYAHKLTREDTQIDWTKSAQTVAKMIRALDPIPGAQSTLRAQTIKLWRSRAHDRHSVEQPGTVVKVDAGEVHVACGNGVLIVTELQRAGGKRLAAGDFVRGFGIRVGDRLGS